jgi:M26 IgA1-specific Metallo-endopeptidase N-terminal region/The GLUG motif
MNKFTKFFTICMTCFTGFGCNGISSAFNDRWDIEIHFIYTVDDLKAVKNNLGAYYVLMADLDLSGETAGTGWQPIGTPTPNDPFTGTFDGTGHTIRNLTISSATSEMQGLFGNAVNCTIKNLNLLDVSISSSNDSVGGLAGSVIGSSTINNCYVTGTVQGGSKTGGIIGDFSGTLTGCSASVAVTGSDDVGGLIGFLNIGRAEASLASGNISSTDGSAGGLIGTTSKSAVVSCYATGAVTGSSTNSYQIGGLIGSAINNSIITSCYATGTVSCVNTNSYVGGLAGYCEKTDVTDCYATGNVSGLGSAIGGLIGSLHQGSINNSYATGSVTGALLTGGLLGLFNGETTGSIISSYATGNVTGSGMKIGGLIGYANNGITISLCYATGSVSVSGSGSINNIGGFVGENGVSISDSYATGNVVVNGPGYNRGGFTGVTYTNISNSYATGNVSSSGQYFGGFAAQTTSTALITHCYSTGFVSGSQDAAGFISVNSGTAVACFYNSQTSGFATSSSGITAVTTLQMKTINTYTTEGWNFSDIWTLNGTVNNGYPYISALIP